MRLILVQGRRRTPGRIIQLNSNGAILLARLARFWDEHPPNSSNYRTVADIVDELRGLYRESSY